MQKKTLYLLSLLSASLVPFTSLNASPLVTLGDSVNLHFVGDASFDYDSNIYKNYTGKDDDFIYTLTPGLELATSGNSEFQARLLYQQEMKFYADHQNLDQQNEIIKLNAGYNSGGIVSMDMNASYRTNAYNTNFANVTDALIRRRNYDLGFDTFINLSPKTQIQFAPSLSHVDVRNYTNLFSDKYTIVAPTNFYYLYSPKLKFGAGYQYSYTDFEKTSTGANPADRSNHFINLRVDGQIGPRLSTMTALGWDIQHINGFDTYSNFSIDSSLTWEATQRLELEAGIRRYYGSSQSGSNYLNTRGRFDVTYLATEKISASAGFYYGTVNYKTRDQESDIFGTHFRLSYTLNKYFNFSAGYNYTNNDDEVGTPFGSSPIASFNVHNVNLTANVKY